MIDVHCHLNFHTFEEDYHEVIKRAKEKGVSKIINTGTKIDSSEKAVELAQMYEDLYAIVGIHPHHADKLTLRHSRESGNLKNLSQITDENENWEQKLEELAKRPKVVGIGEIGLDYYEYKSNGVVDKALQKELFLKQLELSFSLNLPLQIHNRHAGEDIVDILEAYKNNLLHRPGMFHCFAGTKEVLKRALNLGFYIGFDGNSTYKGLAPGETVELKELAKYTPLERILTETDAPFLTPVPYRGTRNEPGYVILVGEFLAQVKGISFLEFDAQTTTNAETLFSLK